VALDHRSGDIRRSPSRVVAASGQSARWWGEATCCRARHVVGVTPPRQQKAAAFLRARDTRATPGGRVNVANTDESADIIAKALHLYARVAAAR